MYIILIIILFIISYFVLNIYEKFQAIEEIEHICYYDDFDKLYYRKGDDNKIIVVNAYLNDCLNKKYLIYPLYNKNKDDFLHSFKIL
jgi:hypothetical protein